jgi:nitrite reductase/ring-hydroxylating ferredoxin subunit
VKSDRQGWYPVSLSDGVEAGSSMGTYLFGEEIVVWRDATGAAHIWEDRCPHRGMRLSYGFVRSDRIACLYHGWQYGTDGHCLRIPAHPEVQPPRSIVTWRHSCREAIGLIFAHFGDATGEPVLPHEAAGREFVPVRSIHVDLPAEALADRFAAVEIPSFHTALEGANFAMRLEASLLVGAVEKSGISEVLIGAVQPIEASRSAIHLLVAGSAIDYRGAGQRHFSKLAESFRDGIEGGWLPAARPVPAFA